MRRSSVLLLAFALVVTLVPSSGASQTRIINGQPADPGEYPTMTAMFLRQPDGSLFQFCGGSLIGDRYVLTAAHCISDANHSDGTMGGLQITTMTGTDNYAERPVPTVDVATIIMHPHYGGGGNPNVNDVAVLVLAQALPGPYQALASARDVAAPGRQATVVGFGATEPHGSAESASPQLLEVGLPTVDDASCDAQYGNIDADRMVCAGDPGTEEDPGNDSCQGDSGGPMFDDATGEQNGVVSFGGLCGVEAPGVYAEVFAYLAWIGGILAGGDGSSDPANDLGGGGPDPIPGEPIRIEAGGPTVGHELASTISFNLFEDAAAEFAVVARGNIFADALGGSALHFGIAPMFLTQDDGSLSQTSIDELRRVVIPEATVYVLGGPAAVPDSTLEQIALAGYGTVRLAGASRHQTAIEVAREVVFQYGSVGESGLPIPPQGSVIVAFAGNWPDAVTVGSISSWWGIPVLLTNTNTLDAGVANYLREIELINPVLVTGGPVVVSDQVLAEIEAITGQPPIRLAGPTRFHTGAVINDFNRFLYEVNGFTPPEVVTVTNLRRDDAWSHVLSGSMLTGRLAGLFAPVEGTAGDTVVPEVGNSVCGLTALTVALGGVDAVTDAAALTTSEYVSGACGRAPRWAQWTSVGAPVEAGARR